MPIVSKVYNSAELLDLAAPNILTDEALDLSLDFAAGCEFPNCSDEAKWIFSMCCVKRLLCAEHKEAAEDICLENKRKHGNEIVLWGCRQCGNTDWTFNFEPLQG